MRKTITITVGWWIIAIFVIALSIFLLPLTRDEPEKQDRKSNESVWPQVVRTYDGQLTTVMPEDLGR